MTTVASSVIATVSTLLQDTTNVRWGTTELLGYLNDGQKEVAVYKPSASVVTESAVLVDGSRQTLPTGGLVLVDVVRNMGLGSTPGNAIRIVAREILDAQVPNWHTVTDTAVKHFVYSALDPKTYYVYPHISGGGKAVEIVYGKIPTTVASIGANITLDDVWVPALINYICYRAYSKDAEYAANATAAGSYYQQFMGQMTGKTAGEQATNPNISMGNFNPNVPGMK